MPVVSIWLSVLTEFMPRILVAVLIAAAGIFVGSFVRDIVVPGAASAGIGGGRLLGIIRYDALVTAAQPSTKLPRTCRLCSVQVVVFLWRSSFGLTVVIGISMVFSMVIAGLSGAIIPILLKAFGQDPAQSSSIILTTVTDICGFMSFLGLATLLEGMLGPS